MNEREAFEEKFGPMIRDHVPPARPLVLGISYSFASEPISTYRECLDITLHCVASSIEVIGPGSSDFQKRQVYGGGRLCYSARRRKFLWA